MERGHIDQGVATVAMADDKGELFEYRLDQPVTLSKHQSALLPIIGQSLQGQKLAVYNQSVNAQHPLNGYRLAEMLILVRKTRVAAAKHDFDMSFIRPYTRTQKIETGEKLFAKGDKADAMYIVESGHFVLPESGIELSAGAIVGELGLLAPGGLRTQSLVCKESGAVLRLGYEQFKQLHFQNPKFGYYFLQLTTERLFENIATLEQTLTKHGIPNPLNANPATNLLYGDEKEGFQFSVGQAF